jgi:hypothetical protein
MMMMKWKRHHIKISREEIRQIIEGRKTEFTERESLIEEYMQQNKASKIKKRRPTAVTKCPICKKVCTRNDWHPHRKFEMEIRVGSRHLHKDDHNKYKCPVKTCRWGGDTKHTRAKAHCASHSILELETAGINIYVRLTFFQINKINRNSSADRTLSL